GFGCVYKAVHTLMGRVVAVKVISPEWVKDERARNWFLREVKAVTQLSHPNLVLAYDANEADGVLFLAMEYVNGPNLDQLVARQGRLPGGLTCERIRQAGLALQYAHEKGRVPRDIKPGTLLIALAAGGGPPVVKVVDFGLARLRENVHEAARLGTLQLQKEG